MRHEDYWVSAHEPLRRRSLPSGRPVVTGRARSAGRTGPTASHGTHPALHGGPIMAGLLPPPSPLETIICEGTGKKQTASEAESPLTIWRGALLPNGPRQPLTSYMCRLPPPGKILRWSFLLVKVILTCPFLAVAPVPSTTALQPLLVIAKWMPVIVPCITPSL